MALYTFRPVANGLGTDHPIPDLPFVDDSHLPLEPDSIEAVGRKGGGKTWGRRDNTHDGGGWAAFTTDPERNDLAWYVRYHPSHGRSVMLVRDGDASIQHHTFAFELRTALLFRAGGYWWDGDFWYRPPQIFDMARERVVPRLVPGASTVTAADSLDPAADPARARLLTVAEFDLPAAAPKRWADDLALWAEQRPGTLPLDQCVVRLAAPELTGDQLVGVGEMAKIGGIAAATLRAYNARGEAEIPEPQAVIGGRNAWARPVAEEWAEQRRQSHESVAEAVSVDRGGATMAVGVSDLWARWTSIVFTHLWTLPGARQRWALRFRSEKQVRGLAEDLAWSVAAGLKDIVPIEELAVTIERALLDEIATGQESHRSGGRDDETEDWVYYGLFPQVAKMLDWLVRHEPNRACRVITDVIGEAERRLAVPRHVTKNTIETALTLDSQLDRKALAEFLERAMPADE